MGNTRIRAYIIIFNNAVWTAVCALTARQIIAISVPRINYCNALLQKGVENNMLNEQKKNYRAYKY